MLVEMTITTRDGKTLSLVFDSFPEAVLSNLDIKELVQEITSIPVSQQHLIREYPTLRPVVFVNEQRLFGFAGISSRGLWTEPPYPGPIQVRIHLRLSMLV